jgi:hypothetical protein
MFRTFLILFCLAILTDATSQTSAKKISIGVEEDLLPFATGGFFGGLWAGKDHIRGRALIARVYKPDFIIKKGFSNNNVTAYALLADYFLKDNWNGWWAGAGIVYWRSSIKTSEHQNTAQFKNTLLNGSIGYNWKFYKNFYLSPWTGMHLRVAGDKEVKVDDKTFNPPLLNPEASLKLGFFF